MQRFLEVYWVIYFQAYLAAVGLTVWGWRAGTLTGVCAPIYAGT